MQTQKIDNPLILSDKRRKILDTLSEMNEVVDSDDYVSRRFTFYDSGAFRNVYKLGRNYVLKVAIDEDGREHNLHEIELSKKNYYFLTKIYDYTENGNWLIAEKVAKLDRPQFCNVFNFHYYAWEKIVIYEVDTKLNRVPYEIRTPISTIEKKKILSHKFTKDIINFCVENKLAPRDIVKVSSLGMKKNREVCVIDYGLTYKEYIKINEEGMYGGD